MVIIVITAPPARDVENARPTITFKKNELTTRTESRESTGPSSYDSGVNTDSDTKDLKLFLRENKFVYDNFPSRLLVRGAFSPSSDSTGEFSLNGLELSSKDSGFSNLKELDSYLELQRSKDFELLKQLHGHNTNVFSSDFKLPVITRTDSSTFQVEPDSTTATTREEEWVTKKKVELTTKRQIETRVKRQVVLEDGRVVEDSGPIVTTNTTEDTEKQEHNQTEHRTSGDDPEKENWVPVPGPNGLVKEVREKFVKSREESEERLETEDVQQLGDISDEGYMKAVKSGRNDVEAGLKLSRDTQLVSSRPRVVYQSSKTRKTIDTQDTRESSELLPDGKLITESKTTTEHQVIDDTNVPDDKRSNAPSIEEEVKKDSSHKYRKTKEQDLTEYRVNGVKIGQKMRYEAETAEGERVGDPADIDQLDSLSTRIKRMRLTSQNHKLAIENGVTQDRKDALTKRPLNFDQEEATRKVETSKWLEHHFGSESTRSSKGSLNDLDDVEVQPAQHSFINVTMKSAPVSNVTSPVSKSNSPESDPPKQNGYYQGISHWSSRRNELEQEYATPVRKINRQTITSPTAAGSPPSPSPTYHITSQQINPVPLKTTNNYEQTTQNTFVDKYSLSKNVTSRSKLEDNESRAPVNNHRPLKSASRSLGYVEENGYPSPPYRRKNRENGYHKTVEHTKSWERPMDEPEPDYPQRSNSPSPEPREDVTMIDILPNKKLYQRTRFAADIPPPPPKQPPPPPVKQQKSKFGESFRKLVGKFRSTSSERKNKKLFRNGASSRSPSPKETTYQQYNVIDNNIPSVVVRVGSRHDEVPVAPPRGAKTRPVVDCSTQTSQRSANNNMENRSIQRYYLGEDPFAGSMYGREKEYDGVTQLKTNRKQRNGIIRRTNGEDLYSTTLGRLSKSTSRLTSSELRGTDYDRGGVQTLPRKLRDESRIKKQVQPQRSLGETSSSSYWEQQTNRYNTKLNKTNYSGDGTGSMINVSFVNSTSAPSSNIGGVVLNGPAKPARTYRTNLLRSKSFNVQVGDEYKTREPYKSNPQLHRLEESQEPLTSPRIISSLNRSTRDVTDSVDNKFQFPKSSGDAKRKLFMKGLLDRAPELYKTLHSNEVDDVRDGRGTPTRIYTSTPMKTYTSTRDHSIYDNSHSRHLYKPLHNGSSPKSSILSSSSSPCHKETSADGNTTRSVIRRGSSNNNDDYSETVRISSKSDDPIRPSQTDTVQTFSKKTIPTKNGLSTETIKSRETKTVTKSHYRRPEIQEVQLNGNGSLCSSRSSPGGVVIEVKNLRK